MTLLTTEKIPTWALNYLEYGVADGLYDEDIELVDEFIGQFPRGFVMEAVNDFQSPYFTRRPAFGLACDVYDIKFYEP